MLREESRATDLVFRAQVEVVRHFALIEDLSLFRFGVGRFAFCDGFGFVVKRCS